MSIFKGLLRKLGIATKEDIDKASKGEIEDLEDYSKSYRRPKKALSYKEMQNFYEHNEWVRACVDQIVATCAKVKPYIAAINEDEKISEETQSHIDEVTEFLANPNSKEESFQSVRRKILKDILVYDAGATEIVYDDQDKPAEIYDLPGQRIRINADKHGDFIDPEKAYYMITEKGFKKELIPFHQNELIYFTANPQSGSLYGLSPLESLVNTVDADLNASEYNANFFKNNAEPSGIINIEGLSTPAFKRFQAFWRKEFRGVKNAHKIAATSGKNVSFTRMSESQKDMQFMEYQKWLLQKILTVYRVKPFVLGIVDATTGKLNSAEQWTAFKEIAIDPLLSLESYMYTTKLIQAGFGYNDIELRFEEIDIKDEKATAEIVANLSKAGIMTINEIRKMYYGLEDVDWGNRPLAGGSSMSITPGEETKSLNEKSEEPEADHEETQTEDVDLTRVADKIREILERREE